MKGLCKPDEPQAAEGSNAEGEMNGRDVLLEVEPDEAAYVASHLFASFPVKDIGITGPPLEKIIESIYLRS